MKCQKQKNNSKSKINWKLLAMRGNCMKYSVVLCLNFALFVSYYIDLYVYD